MHRIIFSLFLFSSFRCGAQHPALSITHLAGNCYVYTTYHDVDGKPFPSNSMYVLTKDGAVLLDTPWDSTQFQPLLDSIAVKHHQKVRLCIATHFHADRTAGLEFYSAKGISTWSSRQTFDLCAVHHDKQAKHVFDGDTSFNVGGVVFKTYYPGGGHTKDNIVVWCPGEKILYAGCLVKSTDNQSLGNIEDADLQEWPASIRRLLKAYADCRYVVPGHFSWGNISVLTHTLELVQKSKQP